MKRPIPLIVSLEDRVRLREIVEKATAPRRVCKRALILLIASERGDERNATNARQLTDHGMGARAGVCADTVRSTLQRFREAGLDAAVYDKPFVRKVSAEAELTLLTLVRSQPPPGLARWTLELLAQELRNLNVVESISDTGVWDLLQKRGIRIERNGALSQDSPDREKGRAISQHDRNDRT